MEPPVTPPRKIQSSLRQAHRHHEDAASYASPPKTPMLRSEPQTPTANTSRKRGRDTWAPATPTSLPRRKRRECAARLSAEWAAGDEEDPFENIGLVGTETEVSVSHAIAAAEPLATRDSRGNSKQYIAIAVYWDADVIGVVCPFCMETEIHLMPRPSNTSGVDLRVPDCDPGKTFRLLFAGDDHPAVKGRKAIWAVERRRWEAVYIEDLCSEVSEAGSEVEELEESTTEEPICSGDLHHGDPEEILEDREEDQISTSSEGGLPVSADNDVDLPIAFSSDESTTEEPICSGDQNHGDPEEVVDDMEVDQIMIPGEVELPLAADGDLDLPIAFSDDDGEEAITLEENPEILRVTSRLFNNPPPEYLTLGHGQTAVVYRPVAVIPVLGAPQKTVGFLAPMASSARRVFTRSGWRGEEITDADTAWLQDSLCTNKEAPWQDLRIINNRHYTDKVRELSAHLGLEPRYHNYDKENPLGQVCFSHVEKQLVVVALEEHQSSNHLGPTESLINRKIYLDRAPCRGCLDFAKAVEREMPLRFTFIVMTRVMSDEQVRKKIGNGDEGKEREGNETDDSADDEISANDYHNQRSSSPKATRMNKERQSAGEKTKDVYEVSAIVGRRILHGEVEYLVEWKEMWQDDVEYQAQLKGLYAKELHLVCEMAGRGGKRRRLIRWTETWMHNKDLYNSRTLIREYESGRGLLD
ncbi:hypothetical protein V501_02698 [Pseudogymnoascus sp. VKM F-4519 (FW-2642)]|nr:hypothetical protein V501_02698 [Pseudogymnoascus sp. VKM F-4519 (FW-2642)]